MKKVFILFSSALLIFACAKEVDTPSEVPSVRTYTITADLDNPTTRSLTAYDESINKFKFTWEENEYIGVVPSGYSKVLGFQCTDPANGLFSYTRTPDDQDEYNDGFTMAVSPREALGNVSTTGSYTVTYPDLYFQGKSNAIMVAGAPTPGSDDTQHFSFKHLGALVKVSYANVPAGTYAMVFSTPDHDITGAFTFNSATGVEAVAGNPTTNTEAKVIFLDEPDAVLPSVDFYLPIPTGQYQTFNVKLVQQVNEEEVTIEGSEKTFSTASPFTVNRADVVRCPVVTVTPPVYTNYTKVTADDNLPAIGDIIIVGSKDGDTYAMAADRGNNRGSEIVPDPVSNVITLDNSSAAHVFTIKHTQSGYLISDKADGNYLYTTSSGNHLKTTDKITSECYWSFSFTDGVLDLVNCSLTSKHLRFNSGNNPPIFSCYANGQSDISIYLNGDSVVEELDTPTITVAVNGSTITVNWVDDPNATSYLVTCTDQTSQTINTGVQSASFTGLADGIYEVSVTAKTSISGYVDSASAVASNITVGTPTLTAPTDVSVQQTGTGISASWSAVDNATNYDWTLYDNEGLTSIVASGNVNNATTLAADVTLTTGTTYYFTVKAKAEGYTTSPASAAASFTALALASKVFTAQDYEGISPSLTLTKAPITGTFAKGGGTDTPYSNGSRIRVYQKTGGGKGGTLTITSTSANIMRVEITFVENQFYLASDTGSYDREDIHGTWTTTDAVNSVEFYCNGSNSGQRADIASFTVYYVPSSSEQLVMSDITCDNDGEDEHSLVFIWDAVDGAEGYQVSSDGSTFGSTQSARTYTLSGLQPGTTHAIWVKAIGNGTTTTDSEAKKSANGTTKSSGGDDDPAYVLSSAISAGKYILVNTYGSKDYICSGVVSNKALPVIDASSLISNGIIASNSTTDAYAVTIEETTGGYTIKNSTGNYIGANKGDLTASTSSTVWTITEHTDNSWIISCISGRALFIGNSGSSCKNYATSNLGNSNYSSTYMILYKYNK